MTVAQSPTFWVIIGLILVIAGFALTAQGQSDNPDNTCYEARTWHLRQALRYSQSQDQDYHLKAAEAADELVTGCSGWNTDAHTTDANGDSSAEGLDAMESQQEEAQATRVQP